MTTRRILEALRDGDLGTSEARQLLRGRTMPNEAAQLVKRGMWASRGPYPAGDDGARLAARDALIEPGPKAKS